MPTCPKCGAEIDKLIYIGLRPQRCIAYVAHGCLLFDFIDEADDLLDGEYCCPLCNEVLFRNDGDAEEFLKGGIPGVVLKRLSGGRSGKV